MERAVEPCERGEGKGKSRCDGNVISSLGELRTRSILPDVVSD